MPMAQLEDSLDPDGQINFNDDNARADLWLRVRRGFAMPDLDNDGVRKAEAWYSARPDYVQRMTERGGRYLYHIVEEVEKRGMPTELALLPFIESAYNPQAMSTAKASGMWQFVPSTGRDFSLKQNIFRDDRRDVLASTRAALDYLDRLHTMFGDWQLALAAYNWGPGNVQRAVARNQKLGLPTDYDNLKLPDETRYYVPKLQAVKNIVLRPGAYGLSLPEIANHPYFLSVRIERDMDVGMAARLADMELESFRQFNPQLNKPVILAASTPQLLLPYDNAGAFVANLGAHQGPLATWTAWVVPKTMNPGDAAKRVGMNEAQLREVNTIPPRMLVKQGSTLLVPRAAHLETDVPEHMAETASLSLTPDLPPLRRVTHKAARGDTVASVAKRYKVSPEQVAQWNKTAAHGSFKAGQQVVLFVPNGRTSKPAASVHANASSKTARPVHKNRAGRNSADAGPANLNGGHLARQMAQQR
ncbi:MAG: transglycosylase SLT domain-containing protein [Burkholderiaceae bacterium]|nr:transglycosylase SLT domain-containing protein [Burkholderiaceae bacterium]